MSTAQQEDYRQKLQDMIRSRNYWPADLDTLKLLATELISISSEDPKTRAGLLGALIEIGLPLYTQLPWVNNTTAGMLTLCVRVKGGFPEGLDELLRRGADIAAGRSRYYTVLESAIGERDVECVRVILRNRSIKELMEAEVFSRDGSRVPRTLLQTFSSRPRGTAGDETKILELLLEAGLPSGGLLRHVCTDTCGDFPEAIDLLAKYGCDLNDCAHPPLTVAAGAGKPKMVQRLLELGADPAARTAKGATVMQCAGRHPEVKQVLMSWKTAGVVAGALDLDSQNNGANQKVVTPKAKKEFSPL